MNPPIEPLEFRRLLSTTTVMGPALMPIPVTGVSLPRAVIVTSPVVSPSSPANLTVRISAGQVKLPSGAYVSVKATTLTLAAPKIVHRDWTVPAPQNLPVTTGPAPFDYRALGLVPAGVTGVTFGLYHSVIPSSVVVRNSAGRIFTRGTDYGLHSDWGQLVNVGSHLGQPGVANVTISFDSVLQRLDLIEVLPTGQLKVKQGVSAASVPALPSPDAGAVALAGVHVYTIDGARRTGFTIQARDIYPIRSVAPAATVNPSALTRTLTKLRQAKPVTVAYLGDSITAGAENANWWKDRTHAFTTLVSAGLKGRFGSTVTTVAAWQPGINSAEAGSLFQSQVLGPTLAGTRKVDVVVIALGMNDWERPPAAGFKAVITDYVRKAKAAGIDVLLVTPMQGNPFYDAARTGQKFTQVIQDLRSVAATEQVTLADVYADWINQGARGIAPFSQLHNTYNHPDEKGQALYATTILRAFPR